MLFANTLMLIGLSAALIPVIIHLLNRRSAENLDWGAMQFLLGSVVSRRRRMLFEEILLLSLRCLLLALLAVAMALPFVPPASTIPWSIILPAVLLGSAMLGAGTVLWDIRGWRWGLIGTGALLLLLAVTAGCAERWIQTHRWRTSGAGRDVAIVIDGSASMQIEVDGKKNFDRAVEEARTIAAALGPGDGASVIVAGIRPRLILGTPVASPTKVSGAIARVRPTGGRMAVHEALATAAATLDEGGNPNRTIVLITDGQAAGWKSDGDVNWEVIAETFQGEEPKPQLLVRLLPVPGAFRNIQVSDISLSRDVIGLDRPVLVDVKVENTGTETVMGPFEAVLRVDGKAKGAPVPVGTLHAGAAETVTFRPRFDRAGGHTIEARVVVDDDLALDNTAARSIRTLATLPVALFDFNRSSRATERSGAYISWALSPLPLPVETDPLLRDEPATNMVDLVDLTPIPAEHAVGHLAQSVNKYRVVILADVPRLAAEAAHWLAEFVAGGGGLLIAPGENSLPDFYNQWKTEEGVPVLPAAMGERWTESAQERALHPAAGTFTHRGFGLVRDTARSDIATAGITACWRLQPDAADPDVSVCGSFDNGEPFAVERRLGEGRVIMTAVSLDARGSDLPALGSFAPFVHEMVYALIPPPERGLEFDPGDKIELALTDEDYGGHWRSGRMKPDTPGLRADYFVDQYFSLHGSTQIDKTPNFSWQRNPPAPDVPPFNFAVRWTGSIIPPKPDEYAFFLRGHGLTRLWIDGKLLIEVNADESVNHTKYEEMNEQGYKEGKIRLAAEPHALRIEYQGAYDNWIYCHAKGSDNNHLPLEQTLRVGKPWQLEFPAGTAVTVTPPSGPEFPVVLDLEDLTLLASVSGTYLPGVYELALPDFIADSFRTFAVDGKIPFVARSVPEESHMTTLSDADFAGGAKVFPLAAVRSTEEVVHAITGALPGRRLWRHLALAALAAVLLEVALTRWIATQRRLGATRRVDFTSAVADGGAARLKTLRGFGLAEQDTETVGGIDGE